MGKGLRKRVETNEEIVSIIEDLIRRIASSEQTVEALVEISKDVGERLRKLEEEKEGKISKNLKNLDNFK